MYECILHWASVLIVLLLAMHRDGSRRGLYAERRKHLCYAFVRYPAIINESQRVKANRPEESYAARLRCRFLASI